MSELLQSGQHPDADQLSAFIEHALPAHEQEETLAHLAICSHCRNLVALSIPATDPLPQEPARRPWLSGWMMVWPAGAALAALILAGIYVRNGLVVEKRVPPTQTARSIPPAPLKEEQPAPAVKLQLRSRAVPQTAPVPEATPQAADRLMPVPVPGAGGNNLPTNPDKSSTFSASAALKAGIVAQPSTTVSVSGGNQALQTGSPAFGGMLAMDQALAVPRRHSLPSGLRTLSVVANARQVVAIDTNNTLFFSNDAGAHWNAIAPPWQGRAVKVELVPATYPPSARNAPAAATAGLISGSSVEGPKATLSGAITDPTGASIPNASVAVTNSVTQSVRKTTTNSAGHYTLDQLDPGTYTVKAEAPGFTSQQISGLTLNPTQTTQKDLTLAVGSLAQSVEVQGPEPVATTAPVVKQELAGPRAPVSPGLGFEITTDTGEHWISIDGQTWHRKDE